MNREPRYRVDMVAAYGRESYRVIDRYKSGKRPYVVCRCDVESVALVIAALLDEAPNAETCDVCGAVAIDGFDSDTQCDCKRQRS